MQYTTEEEELEVCKNHIIDFINKKGGKMVKIYDVIFKRRWKNTSFSLCDEFFNFFIADGDEWSILNSAAIAKLREDGIILENPNDYTYYLAKYRDVLSEDIKKEKERKMERTRELVNKYKKSNNIIQFSKNKNINYEEYKNLKNFFKTNNHRFRAKEVKFVLKDLKK